MSMSKKEWVGLVVAIIVVAFAGIVWVTKSKESGAIKFGATLPLTGDAAAWGKNTQEGIDLAVEEINSTGGILGRKIIVIYEDTKALPKEGVSAYQKLVTVDKVHSIIDDSVSSVTLAIAPMAKKDDVVILSTGATAPKISEAGIFRIWNSDAYEGEVSADFTINTMGLRSVAILYINNEYGKGLEEVFRVQFTKKGGLIPISEAFAQNATDMKTQLAKIKSIKPSGLYLVGYPKEIPIALRQAKELGLILRILGTVAMQDPQLIESAGNAAEGLLFPYPKEPRGEQVARFKEAFMKRYGREPGITSDVGYDAVKMLAEAIKKSGDDTAAEIRKGLRSLKDYPGVSGVMTFDDNGDVHKPMGIKMVSGGNFIWKQEQ